MDKPYFKINGVDILPFLLENGIQWGRNDVDSDKAGRVKMNATMFRDRTAIKFKANLSCRDLNRAEELRIMNLILPVFVEVETNLHPLYEHQKTSYYSNNVPVTISHVDSDTGDSVWTGLTFPLVER